MKENRRKHQKTANSYFDVLNLFLFVMCEGFIYLKIPFDEYIVYSFYKTSNHPFLWKKGSIKPSQTIAYPPLIEY